MIVYNITTNVNRNIHDLWLEWYRNEHIPEIMATRLFERFSLMRILDIDETEGYTYALQLFAENSLNYQQYLQSHAPELREKAMKTWGDGFISFRTTMEVIN